MSKVGILIFTHFFDFAVNAPQMQQVHIKVNNLDR